MNFEFPDSAAIERNIQAARVERAVYLGQAIAAVARAVVGGFKRICGSAARRVEADGHHPAI